MSTTLTAAVDAVKAKEAELLTILNDSVTPVLGALSELGTIGVLYIYGYTPGFNDGEPCEHSTDYFIGLEDIASEERLDEFLSMTGAESESLDEWADVPYKSKWQKDAEAEIEEYESERARLWAKAMDELGFPETGEYDRKEVNAAIQSVVIPALDREFDTNYQVAYIFENGTFKRFDTEYDCGY